MPQGKLQSQTVSGAIARELESLIVESSLRPGDRLPSERVLAERMGASRASVREALQKLAARGLVQQRQGGGTFVCDTHTEALADPLAQLLETRPETIYDLIEFRQALEGIAAHYAALRATETDRATLRRRLEAIERAHEGDDPAGEANADADFHLAVAEATHNVVLLHVMRGVFRALRGGIESSRQRLYMKKGSREALYSQHQGLYEAVIAGDAKAARRAVTEHLDYVKAQLMEIQREAEWEGHSLRRLSPLGD